MAAGLVLLFSLAGSTPVLAQVSKARDLSEFSLEDLMNVHVTSVSKKEQKLSRAGAAVYVITQEDIRRSGANSIPDLLRLAPGVDVKRVDANSWAISIRGFTDRYANKVLVLIDGRSVYNPVFSGVIWDAQDVPVEDIERIEVIRGPGGTVWGANAVNGVINIITKKAQDTQGGLIAAGGGSEERGAGLIRYGGLIGRKGAYRVFGRYFNTANSAQAGGAAAADAWHGSHGGFRSDWDLSSRDTLTVQGDLQRNGAAQTVSAVFSSALPLAGTIQDRVGMSTANVLGRWTHSLAQGSEMSVQVYDDSVHRDDIGIHYSQNTVDLTLQHHVAIGSRNDVVWGVGARSATTDFGRGYSVALIPPRKTDRLFSTFVQDEVRIANALWLTVGSKVEHNDYTGFELEPSAQIVWTPTNQHAIWISAARAIRQPSRVDAGVQYDMAVLPAPGAPFAVVTTFGNPAIQAERLQNFEIGYRGQLDKRMSLDLAIFSGFYDDLQTPAAQAPYFTASSGSPYLVLPFVLQNDGRAQSYGAELFLNWNATKRWRVSPGYSTVHIDPNANATPLAANTPKHQFQFRSFLNLRRNLEWDHTLAYVSGLRDGGIPAYVRLDSRFGWRIAESVELSVTGQNLLRPRHAEFPDEYGLHHTEIERSVFGKIVWRF